MLLQSTLRSRLPGVFTTGELRLAGIFITGESFWTPGSRFTDFKEHITIFKGTIIQKIESRILNYIGTFKLCLKKLPYFRDSNRLPGVFITGESFWTPGSRFTDFKEHITIFKGTIIQKIDCRLL